MTNGHKLVTILAALTLARATFAADKPAAATQQEKQDEGFALTIYNQNFGDVRERRNVNVEKTFGTIRFSDVAAQIDGTSVSFKSLTDPDATVLEQNYEYDLVSTDKLLQKYIDKPLTVLAKDGSRSFPD